VSVFGCDLLQKCSYIASSIVFKLHTRNILEGITGTNAEGEAISEEGQWGGNADC